MANIKPVRFGVEPSKSQSTVKPDRFGQVNDNQKDSTRGGSPSSGEVTKFHQQSDVDSSAKSQHHTLGTGRGQASPGNHTHDGTTSSKVTRTGTESLSFTSQSLWTVTNIPFDPPFPEGVIPVVTPNIHSGVGNTARWYARGIDITNIDFTLFVAKGDAADPAQTWVDVPVQWKANE